MKYGNDDFTTSLLLSLTVKEFLKLMDRVQQVLTHIVQWQVSLTHTRLTALFQDYPGELVAER